MTSQRIVLGNLSESAEGAIHLGRHVTYPMGSYQEVGDIFLDIASPHCILVLGKRGSGKSHTIGVMIEGFLSLPEDVRNNMAVVVVDVMSVFHGLRTHTNHGDAVRILMPKIALEPIDGVVPYHDDILRFRAADLQVGDWMELFGLDRGDSLSMYLMDLLSRMEGNYSIEDILAAVEANPYPDHIKMGLRYYFGLARRTGLFSADAPPFPEMIQPGSVTIADIGRLREVGGLDLRAAALAIMARSLLDMRLGYSVLETQSECGLVDTDIPSWPLVYMFIDEAHLFLPSQNETVATSPLVDWIKLGRHPGLSLVMATQEPSALHESAIRQSDVIISHTLTARADLEALKAASHSFMNGNNDIKAIASGMEQRKGLAVVFDDTSRRVVMCQIRKRDTYHGGGNPCAASSHQDGEWVVLA